MYEIKTRLLTLISNSSSLLSPQSTHVFGNWRIDVFRLPYSSFPVVTVRMEEGMSSGPIYEGGSWFYLHYYDFTLHVHGRSLEEARNIGDDIINYLKLNNRKTDAPTYYDIRNLAMREAIDDASARRLSRVIVTGTILTEETLS